jgi:hypothetical protein
MLKATIRLGQIYEIHGGTVIDYVINLSWKDRGSRATRLVLAAYLEGLLDIASRVESGEIPPGVSIEGESYFFNERTAERLGFSLSQATFRHRANLALHYVDLTILHSFCRGALSFPRIQNVRRVSIPAWRLTRNRAKLEALLLRISR